ncbi:hypothetical protein [Metaclostridioides mangenotii]|uniref:hypothetical protein n=1 Tax=Metaclostridioides mangenotii TaxID=1540 RepID=UPI0004824E20|nr:hypothetical protein [Clostridioides mangenotii]
MKYNLRNQQEIENLIENWSPRDKIIASKMYSEFIHFLKNGNKLITEESCNIAVDLTSKDTEDFVNATLGKDRYKTSATKTSILTKLMNELNLDISFKCINPVNIEKNLFEYPTLKEILDICNSLINYQDRFIVYSVFCGFTDLNLHNLRYLKVSDINFENNIVIDNGKEVSVDDIFIDLANKTKKQRTYYKLMSPESLENLTTSLSYDFNQESGYLIKTKPTSKNENGIRPISQIALRQRFSFLNETLDSWTLTPRHLRIAGFLYKMYEEKKDKWTIQMINDYKSKLGYKIDSHEALITYNQKYNP